MCIDIDYYFAICKAPEYQYLDNVDNGFMNNLKINDDLQHQIRLAYYVVVYIGILSAKLF